MKNRMKQLLAVLLILAMILPVLPLEAFASNGLTAYVTTYGNEITLYGETLPGSAVTLKLTRTSDDNIVYTNEVKSDGEGSYKLMFDVEPGEYKLLVGAIGLTVEKNVKVTDINAGTAAVRVEGLKNTLLKETRVDIEAGHTTYIETIKKALDKGNVNYEPKDQDIINGIGPGLEGLNSSNSWQWIVNGGGSMTLPTDLVSEYDSIVMIPGDLWNPTITEMNVSPGTDMEKGTNFTVKLEQYNVDEFGDTYKTPVSSQTVRFGDKSAVTDEKGEALFTADSIGEFALSCEPVMQDGAGYVLIRPAQLAVSVREQGSMPDNYVYLSVDTLTIGGGYEVKDKPVEWQRGDTAYSVLVRGLGEENIRSSSKTDMGIYVEAIKINGKWEGEFDHGHDSGWMINVNGYYIHISAGYYRVEAGDKVNWRYTTNLGKDLGAPMNRDDAASGIKTDDIKNDKLRELIEDIINRSFTDSQIRQAAEKAIGEALKNTDYDKLDAKASKELLSDLKLTADALLELTEDVKVLDNVLCDITEAMGRLAEKSEDIEMETRAVADIINKALKKNSAIKVLPETIDTSEIKDLDKILDFNDKLIAAFEKTELKVAKKFKSTVEFDFGDGIIRVNAGDLRSGDRKIGLKKSAGYASVVLEPEGFPSGPVNIRLTHRTDGKFTTVILKKDGREVNVGGIYNDETRSITFTAYESGDYYIVENPVEFTDLGGYEWAGDYILSLASKGIISGKGGGSFAPGDNITRAEFAALAVRALKSRQGEEAPASFDDVTSDDWYCETVLNAVQNGIMQGKSGGTFDPLGKITRQEIAVVMANILKGLGYESTDGSLLSQFGDRDEIASWAEKEALLAVETELINGDNGMFRPLSSATRAETAIMLDRLYRIILE